MTDRERIVEILQALAGPDAEIRVTEFELPQRRPHPVAQIVIDAFLALHMAADVDRWARSAAAKHPDLPLDEIAGVADKTAGNIKARLQGVIDSVKDDVDPNDLSAMIRAFALDLAEACSDG